MLSPVVSLNLCMPEVRVHLSGLGQSPKRGGVSFQQAQGRRHRVDSWHRQAWPGLITLNRCFVYELGFHKNDRSCALRGMISLVVGSP